MPVQVWTSVLLQYLVLILLRITSALPSIPNPDAKAAFDQILQANLEIDRDCKFLLISSWDRMPAVTSYSAERVICSRGLGSSTQEPSLKPRSNALPLHIKKLKYTFHRATGRSKNTASLLTEVMFTLYRIAFQYSMNTHLICDSPLERVAQRSITSSQKSH